MDLDTSKIQLDISAGKISISDRMPIRYLEILLFIVVTSVASVFFVGIAGVIYSLFFSLGYVLFRYFAWLIWKRIEIDIDNKKLTITNMLLNKSKSTEILTSNFDYSNFTLKEFEQSGMKRAMIQYQSHKLTDLLLLTHAGDIELIKKELFSEK
jgi:hypothetical protein